MHHYVALIHKDPDTDFGVSFPDFPGCITAGSTVAEAIAMAHEALAFHIDALRADGEVIPAPSTPDQVLADFENRGAVFVLIAATAD